MFALLLLAVVQIIVEVLPISSSGHMRLAALLAGKLGYSLPEPPQYFDEFLHGFTLVTVLIFFRNVWVPVVVRLWQMLRQRRVLRDSQQRLLLLLGQVSGWVFVTTLLTVAAYFGIKCSGIEATLTHSLFLALGFVVTAVGLVFPLFLGSSSWRPSTGLRLSGEESHSHLKSSTESYSEIDKITFTNHAHPELVERAKSDRTRKNGRRVLIITLAQVAACLLPGVSRFGATTVTAIALGISPRRAVQWSWLIFMPLMLGASLLHGIGKFVLIDHNYFVFNPLFFAVCVLAACMSYALFGGVVRLFQTKQSWLLGLYMLLPVSLLLLLCK
ncbi:undecaprenyl-diphosphate phosphatase [Candidatus Dependentiae bacterium]|nr:undecaprenyl-diphosphate phosphatase [Candidatus Dependentiae bacterium]